MTNWAETANPHLHDRFVQGAQLGPRHLLGWVGSKVSKFGVLSTEDPVVLAR